MIWPRSIGLGASMMLAISLMLGGPSLAMQNVPSGSSVPKREQLEQNQPQPGQAPLEQRSLSDAPVDEGGDGGGDGPGDTAADQRADAVRRAVDDLSKDDYAVRQQATIEMWKGRDWSREAVQDAAHNPDPEIAGRAQWILRQWRRGALPDTPPEISRLLQSGDQPAAIERLLEGGQFLAAVVAVEESAGTVDRELIQRRINIGLMSRFPIYVHMAIQSESLPHLLRLIDLVADSNETAACRFELMQIMGLPITDENLLPESAATWPPNQRLMVMAMLLVKLERYDDAIAVAKQSGDAELLLTCRMIAGRWRQIADERLAVAEAAEPGAIEYCLDWCQVMMAADRCGDDALFETAADHLMSPQIGDHPASMNVRWKYLLSHGKVDEALSVLDTISPDAAATVAMDTSRVSHAFDVLGFPLDRVDSDYGKWIDEALDAQRDAGTEQLSPQVRRLLVLMQCLLSIGREDVARIIAKRVADSDGRIGIQRQHRLAEYVLSTLTLVQNVDWMPELAIEAESRSVSADSIDIIARTMDEVDGTTVEILMDALLKMDPNQPAEPRFFAAYELLSGRIPAGFDPATDFAKIFDLVTRPRSVRTVRGMRQNLSIQANMNIAIMFSRHGEASLALACMTKLARSGDTDALFRMAEQALDSGRGNDAQILFDAVYRKFEKPVRVGGSGDVAMAAKALVGMLSIARRSGDQQRSEELLKEIRLVLCSPSSNLRHAVASYLADRDEIDLALEAYGRILPVKAFGSNDSVDLYSVSRVFALTARHTDPEAAARWFDLAILRSIESDDFRPSAFATLPMYVHRWSLEAAVRDGDVSQAQNQVERLLQFNAMDVDLAERLLPKMREASMDELADRTFSRVMDRGTEYVAEFSRDAMTCNNLAWVAAMNDRRLDDALRLSESAVRMEPDSAIFRDTLAEILFLRGDKQAALAIEQGCLLDDPGQWHLHEQIERFSK
ncbi:hypothetical protein [Rubripirellula lacrimiformis]|uniref:hypothetical protein n=1 Tax=Rubripirellula lacrimiformis TaxID=1930273 RepID=UPI0011A6ED80|nr:hypothetical protein [Rubripirellula lacrimiformis]